MLIPLLVTIVKLGVHLPTVLRGFIFYIQISPIAVEFLPQSFKLKVDAVSTMLNYKAYGISVLNRNNVIDRCCLLEVPWVSICHMTSAFTRE